MHTNPGFVSNNLYSEFLKITARFPDLSRFPYGSKTYDWFWKLCEEELGPKIKKTEYFYIIINGDQSICSVSNKKLTFGHLTSGYRMCGSSKSACECLKKQQEETSRSKEKLVTTIFTHPRDLYIIEDEDSARKYWDVNKDKMLKKHSVPENALLLLANLIPESRTYYEALGCFRAGTQVKYCESPKCNNRVRYEDAHGYVNRFCSVTCSYDDEDLVNRRTATNIEKYGDKNPMRADAVKVKIVATNMKRYGVPSVQQNESIKTRTVESYLNNTNNRTQRNVKAHKYNTKLFGAYLNNIVTEFYPNPRQNRVSGLCVKCGSMSMSSRDGLKRRLERYTEICYCSIETHHGSSADERELREYIISKGVNILSKDRLTISPLELDIYIPSKSIAIEFNGIYWHSTEFLPEEYHYDKYNRCKNKGIKLISIFEDIYNLKKPQVLDHIEKELGLQPVLDAPYTIRSMTPELGQKFVEDNSLITTPAKHYIGAFDGNVCIALVSFKNKKVINISEKMGITVPPEVWCDIIKAYGKSDLTYTHDNRYGDRLLSLIGFVHFSDEKFILRESYYNIRPANKTRPFIFGDCSHTIYKLP